MPRLTRFLCPSCGKQLRGDAFDPTQVPACDECGRLAQVWEKADSAAAAYSAPPRAVPPPVPTSPWRVAPIAWLLGAVLLTSLALAGYWLIRSERARERSEREREQAAAADQVVAAKVDAAQAHIARRDFDAALKVLDAALATEHATRLEDARLVVLQARQGQANLLLEAAAAAVARRNTARARQLLNDYLADPHADQKPKATLLVDELARATADDDAVRLLARLSDDQLTAFAESGRIEGGEALTDEGMRELYRDTLRRHLLKELQARETLRDAARAEAKKREREQADREERLRASPLYLEVTTFAAGVRKQVREQDQRRVQEERARELFFRSTGVNDEAERARVREALRAGRDVDNAAVTVIRKKGQVKKDYRQSKDYVQADEDTFDRLVDEALDQLLAEVKGRP
jgi:hypothetical protein